MIDIVLAHTWVSRKGMEGRLYTAVGPASVAHALRIPRSIPSVCPSRNYI
jgi:hypothetical protein